MHKVCLNQLKVLIDSLVQEGQVINYFIYGGIKETFLPNCLKPKDKWKHRNTLFLTVQPEMSDKQFYFLFKFFLQNLRELNPHSLFGEWSKVEGIVVKRYFFEFSSNEDLIQVMVCINEEEMKNLFYHAATLEAPETISKYQGGAHSS